LYDLLCKYQGAFEGELAEAVATSQKVAGSWPDKRIKIHPFTYFFRPH
jgi:hypothetical protein